ncbi:hypothetical protein [Actinoplanes derwentensis]|uniref:Uncharacterized protein n=1 Tax=Actinoplanes derwentensis TaxID=113562 RepID=A0A1H2CDW2_9ACTN|nr:hypothetical protein [Actinoplanes derwentensis]GID87374.1 hypothetical protein Ade03nite_62980 [Actinoplanes derwentensis]SDT68499.1 hypothetical protein SAMN04489716_5633 [Actinoplanes derwentensis]
MTITEQLIELDARRRTTLRIGTHSRYLATEHEDGTIVLEPAIVLTQHELALRSNPGLVDRIEESMRNPAARTRRGRPTPKE